MNKLFDFLFGPKKEVDPPKKEVDSLEDRIEAKIEEARDEC